MASNEELRLRVISEAETSAVKETAVSIIALRRETAYSAHEFRELTGETEHADRALDKIRKRFGDTTDVIKETRDSVDGLGQSFGDLDDQLPDAPALGGSDTSGSTFARSALGTGFGRTGSGVRDIFGAVGAAGGEEIEQTAVAFADILEAGRGITKLKIGALLSGIGEKVQDVIPGLDGLNSGIVGLGEAAGVGAAVGLAALALHDLQTRTNEVVESTETWIEAVRVANEILFDSTSEDAALEIARIRGEIAEEEANVARETGAARDAFLELRDASMMFEQLGFDPVRASLEEWSDFIEQYADTMMPGPDFAGIVTMAQGIKEARSNIEEYQTSIDELGGSVAEQTLAANDAIDAILQRRDAEVDFYRTVGDESSESIRDQLGDLEVQLSAAKDASGELRILAKENAQAGVAVEENAAHIRDLTDDINLLSAALPQIQIRETVEAAFAGIEDIANTVFAGAEMLAETRQERLEELQAESQDLSQEMTDVMGDVMQKNAKLDATLESLSEKLENKLTDITTAGVNKREDIRITEGYKGLGLANRLKDKYADIATGLGDDLVDLDWDSANERLDIDREFGRERQRILESGGEDADEAIRRRDAYALSKARRGRKTALRDLTRDRREDIDDLEITEGRKEDILELGEQRQRRNAQTGNTRAIRDNQIALEQKLGALERYEDRAEDVARLAFARSESQANQRHSQERQALQGHYDQLVVDRQNAVAQLSALQPDPISAGRGVGVFAGSSSSPTRPSEAYGRRPERSRSRGRP